MCLDHGLHHVHQGALLLWTKVNIHMILLVGCWSAAVNKQDAPWRMIAMLPCLRVTHLLLTSEQGKRSVRLAISSCHWGRLLKVIDLSLEKLFMISYEKSK